MNSRLYKIVVAITGSLPMIAVSLGIQQKSLQGYTAENEFQAALAPKSNKFLNVKNFSAQGDGVSDDTGAIQSAINAAADGSTIMFPSGTYNVANFIVKNRSGLSFIGEGHGSTIRQKTGADRIATFVRSRNITITNLAFDATERRLTGV